MPDEGGCYCWDAATLLNVDPSTVRQWSVTVRHPDGSPVPGFVDVPGVGLDVDPASLPPVPSGGSTFDASVTRVESAKLAVTGANVIRLVLIGPLAIAAGLLAFRPRRD